MSIPPLVCSTPPPPDQCEDDRDTEDFDIQYNLSQDDEDDVNNFNYGTYSDYMYPTSTSSNKENKWSPEINEKADNKLPTDLVKENKDRIDVLPEGYSSTIHKVGFEDIIIEDLNLTIEQNDVAPKDDNLNEKECDIEPPEIFSSDKEKDTDTDVNAVIDKIESEEGEVVISQDFVETNYVTIENNNKILGENVIPHMEDSINREIIQDNICADINEIATTEIKSGFEGEVVHSSEANSGQKTDILESDSKGNDAILLENKLDDFEDFDDFQFISSDSNSAPTIEFCDNPWNNEASKDCEFSNFTANFDVDESNKNTEIGDFDIKRIETKMEEIQIDSTDDFGDFNDFKSSSNVQSEDTVIERTKQVQPSQSVPVLNMYTPDSEAQIIESINSVLNSIFTSEISEVESNFEGNIESLLNETWGHLVDTDIRQPYIVHWNSSLGQKSLLKALCIDSRNILFGPKWQNSMPKYAANLTVAPLQPQKPFAPTNTVNENHNIDKNKNTNKETASWTDPFTSDGQEYTYAEALLLDLEHLMATLDQMAHKHSSFKISDLLTHACKTEGGSSAVAQPTNLDVFTNVTPPEVDKIYSSTFSVQPIRQINLPDTHIFTPTDSETPRSKTIHYDQGSAVLVPQPSEDILKSNEKILKPKNDGAVSTLENDDDYWEFQDFKGSSSNDSRAPDKSSDSTENSSTIPITASYEPQILQPIKIEPIMPALNWPAPGEVKETFDDFSDFISSTPWTDSINTAKQTDSQLNSVYKEEFISKTDTLDDDFETFQSAPPLKSSVAPSENTYQKTSNINHNFEKFPQHFMSINEISHVQHSKIDSMNTFKPTENIVSLKTTHNSPTAKDNIKSSPVLSPKIETMNSVLQPTIPSTSSSQQSHKKTGQILQPLTLESYSQINWPNPGIDLQDLSRFNPVESLQSFKSEIIGGSSRVASPAHKDANATLTVRNDMSDDDIWGDFVSSKPKQQQSQTKKLPAFADDDEWTDFVSSPSVKPQNGLNTISLNVHTNSNMQKNLGQGKYPSKSNPISMDIPTLNYVTPKSNNRGLYNDKHFQNL